MLGLAIMATMLVAFLGGLEQGSPGVLVDTVEAAARVWRSVELDYMGQLQTIATTGV